VGVVNLVVLACVVNFLEENSAPPEKILATPMSKLKLDCKLSTEKKLCLHPLKTLLTSAGRADATIIYIYVRQVALFEVL